MLDSTHQTKAQRVLDAINQALEQSDYPALVDQFQDDCYWRDLVSLTWNIKTMEGKTQILDMLESQAETIDPSGFSLDPQEMVTADGDVITAWITFETKAGRGYGLVRINAGKIWTLLTSFIKVKPEIEGQYQDRFNKRHEKMVWQHEKVSSWYQNSKGKVVTTSPWRLIEYWNWSSNFNADDYDFET